MVSQTIEVVENILDRAQMAPSALAAVLLVGGSSRIPLVPQMVTEQLGLPVRIDAHPKLVVAKGAARRAGHDQAGDASRAGRRPSTTWTTRTTRAAPGWLPKVAALVAAALVVAGAGVLVPPPRRR